MKSWWDGAEEYVERIPPGQGNGTDSAWAEKLWSGNIRLTARLKSATADDALGLPEGTRRRKLDPVEIMQRGFEKCLSCFLAEVSPSTVWAFVWGKGSDELGQEIAQRMYLGVLI